jgi:hypothetical protein
MKTPVCMVARRIQRLSLAQQIHHAGDSRDVLKTIATVQLTAS